MFSKLLPVEKRHIWTLSALAIGAFLGIVASFVLSTEALELAKNSNAVLSCNLNAVVNCASVGLHPSASIFGFPNAFLGVMTLPIILVIAVAILMGEKAHEHKSSLSKGLMS